MVSNKLKYRTPIPLVHVASYDWLTVKILVYSHSHFPIFFHFNFFKIFWLLSLSLFLYSEIAHKNDKIYISKFPPSFLPLPLSLYKYIAHSSSPSIFISFSTSLSNSHRRKPILVYFRKKWPTAAKTSIVAVALPAAAAENVGTSAVAMRLNVVLPVGLAGLRFRRTSRRRRLLMLVALDVEEVAARGAHTLLRLLLRPGMEVRSKFVAGAVGDFAHSASQFRSICGLVCSSPSTTRWEIDQLGQIHVQSPSYA